MVKTNPNILDRQQRRRHKFMRMRSEQPREALLLNSKMATNNTTTFSNSSSCDHYLHVQQQTKTKTQELPVTPPPLMKKRRSRSPSYTSSTYATCSSSSPTLSPSSLSSPPRRPSFLDPNSPQFYILSCNFPATAPRHVLRRTTSDPPVFVSDSSPEESSSSKKMKMGMQELDQSPSVSRNLMSLLPPLPPPPSPKLLRRTVSEPVPLLSEKKMKEETVKAEKLSVDWTMLKLKCGCGSDFQFVFNAADNRCYKLV